jgi:hypothetical protein
MTNDDDDVKVATSTADATATDTEQPVDSDNKFPDEIDATILPTIGADDTLVNEESTTVVMDKGRADTLLEEIKASINSGQNKISDDFNSQLDQVTNELNESFTSKFVNLRKELLSSIDSKLGHPPPSQQGHQPDPAFHIPQSNVYDGFDHGKVDNLSYHQDYYGQYGPAAQGQYANDHEQGLQENGRIVNRLNPAQMLNNVLKVVKVPQITSMVNTFPTWIDRTSTIFASCFLECIVRIPAHSAPKTRLEWVTLDNNPVCLDMREKVFNELAAGHPPDADMLLNQKSIEYLNGVFLGVMKFAPSLLHTIFPMLYNSIDRPLRYLAPAKNHVSIHNFRMTYYGIVNYFLISTDSVKTDRLMNFSTAISFTRDQSPAMYSTMLSREREEINELFGKDYVNMMMLYTVFTKSIMRAAPDIYGVILDQNRKLPRSIDGLNELVEALQEKFLDRKSETPGYAPPRVYSAIVPSFHPNGNAPPYPHSKFDVSYQVETKLNAKEKPCFQYQKTGACSYGEKCKFSHSKEILERVNLTTDDILEQVNLIAAENTKARSNFRKSRRQNHSLKTKHNKSKKFWKNQVVNMAKGDTSVLERIKNGKMSYEEAVKSPDKTAKTDTVNLTQGEPGSNENISSDDSFSDESGEFSNQE